MKNLTFIFVISSSFCFAQHRVRGKLVDQQNNPIAFANVIALNANNEIIKGEITNEKGQFDIEVHSNPPFTVVISFMGFEDWKKIITATETTDLGVITLTEHNNELGEVLLTTKKPLIERKVDRLVFNVEKTFLSNGIQLTDILKYVPNVWLNSNGRILIKQKPAIIYVNGKHTNLKGEDLSNYLETISSEEVHKIEVKLNQSADLDGNMNSGVVNIITKSKKGINGIVKSFYNYYDENPYNLYSALSLNYGAKKWNFYTSYSNQEKAGNGSFNSSFSYKKNNKNQSIEGRFNSLSKKQHFKFGFNVDFLKNHNLGIEYYANTDNTDFFGNNTLLFNSTKGTNNTEDTSSKKLQRVNLSYNYDLKSIKSYLKFRSELLSHNFDSDIINNSIYDSDYESNLEKNTSVSNTKMFSSQLDFETTYNEKITSKILMLI